MNPAERAAGRTANPHVERAESADVLDLADTDSVAVVDELPAPMPWIEGSSPMPSILPVRHRAADRRGTTAISAAFVVIVVEAGIFTVLAAVFIALRAGGVL